MVGLTDINTGGLAHLIHDADATLLGTPTAEALFSPCTHGHRSMLECRAGDDVLDTPCRPYRYALTRTWDNRPAAVFVMLNPSTADAFKLDPTVRRCVGYAKRWGCGGLVVLNAFAYRSTDPAGLRCPDPVGPDNDPVIRAVLAANRTGPTIVAWGSDETLRRSGRDRAVVELLAEVGAEPLCLHLTREGYPGHPLYLRADAVPLPYPLPGSTSVLRAGGGR